MDSQVSLSSSDGLVAEIKEASGVGVDVCNQCAKCTGGCPVAYLSDYTPAQLLHIVNLGLRELALGSDMIWLCASCGICSSRCPQKIDVVAVMDALRYLALRDHAASRRTGPATMYSVALQNIYIFGRMYELALGGYAAWYSRRLLDGLGLGVALLKRGKLNLLPDLGAIGKARALFAPLDGDR